MAREKYEIKDSITSQLIGLELSESITAVWNIIIDAVVSGIYIFEKIIDVFKADIEDKIAKKRMGSLPWYVDRVKEFQIDDDVAFFENGTVGYELVDEDKRIIAFATVVESSETVFVKVAKLDNQELSPLSEEEKLQVKRYFEKIMIAGTKFEIVSLSADLIKVEANIYYDPIYSQVEITGFLDTALFEYKTNKEDSIFNRNDFIEMLRDVKGINDVVITVLQGVQGENTTNIVRNYEVVAGYFNYDVSNVYNLIADA